MVTLSGRDREGLVQAAKMAAAAVVAWLVALQLDDSQPFIAPYAAVFMMTGTVYGSLFQAARQVTTVLLGVLIAHAVTLVIPRATAALAVAVFVGMVVGRWHRLGRDGVWVGVVALLMVTNGTAGDASFLLLRVGEAILGAFVGIVVNVLILPPMQLREVGRAVAGVSAETAELLASMASGLRESWDQHDARRWRRQARSLAAVVRHAEEASGAGHESLRLNPRWLRSRAAHLTADDAVLATLNEVAVQVQQVAETLVTSADPDSTAPRTGPVFDTMFADLLATLAGAVAAYQEPRETRAIDRDELTRALAHARDRRAGLARLTAWPDHEPPKDWSAHAAALLAAEHALQDLLDAAG